MKSILLFLRTTLEGGIFFLLPIVVLVIVLRKIRALANHLAVVLAAHVPFGAGLARQPE